MEETLAFQLPELPFALDDLEPHMSRRTLAVHHGKHHKAYIDKLNAATEGTDWEERELREVVQESYGKPELTAVFNNAAQAWNHAFFWHCLTPQGGGRPDPDGDLAQRMERDLGGFDGFRRRFKEAAVGQFGAGWAWLVADAGRVDVVATSNAETPIAHGLQPLLTIDVWEHAYYLDHLNDRSAYVDGFLDNLVNWDFAAGNLEDAGEGHWKADIYREIREAFAASGLGSSDA